VGGEENSDAARSAYTYTAITKNQSTREPNTMATKLTPALVANPETARHRYPEGDELERLLAAVAAHPNRQGAHVIELLLLTGARRSEVLRMRWEQLDLGDGIWTKPASATKQGRLHRIPLSAPARQVLAEIKRAAEEKAAKYRWDPSPWVFPARYGGGPLTDVKHVWAAICRTAGITDLQIRHF
jgi:integrase